jgi:dTDP-L-rhamnose 4-epimerase
MADLIRAEALLDYAPRWKFKDGLQSFLEWASERTPASKGYEQSLVEMKQRGLLHGRA